MILESFKKKTVYTGLDIFKFFSAIMILVLHGIQSGNYYAQGVTFIATRFAVPFFFITSGFFFYKGLEKSENKKNYLIKYEKKLLLMFFIWAIVIYSPFEIASYFERYKGESIVKILLIVARRLFVIGPGPYWYILALMISVLFLFFCYKKNMDKLLICAIIFGLILTIMYSSFNDYLSKYTLFRYLFNIIYFVFSWEFNFIMFGIPFAGLGYLFSKYSINISLNKSIVLFIVATVMRIFEYSLVKIFPYIEFFQNNKINVFFILQAISLFMIAKNYNPKISVEKSKELRQLSSFIYYTHWIILYNIMDQLLLHLYGSDITYNPVYILPKIIIVLTTCILLYVVIRKINNRYLNVLINA